MCAAPEEGNGGKEFQKQFAPWPRMLKRLKNLVFERALYELKENRYTN
jgi:hypothetical protein